ncbi:MAG TPA: hypothetical protein VFI54_06425 [Solirubrobacteraceae bacterium]|nr:hypothetical protein [Solirubrobacteraceae bacterium]
MGTNIELGDPVLSVKAEGELVVLTVKTESIELTPKQAQRFASWLAGAYVQAAGGTHHAPNGALKIGPGPR